MDFRAVSNVDYLSSFLFRLAFNDVFTQADQLRGEVPALPVEGIQRIFFRRHGRALPELLSDGQSRWHVIEPASDFDSIRILHTPSVDASSVDHRTGPHWPLLWSLDGSVAGLSRSEPGFHTSNLLGRFDLNPEISLPLQFHGWSLRPAFTLHETYYSERFVNGVCIDDPTNRHALEASVELRPPILEKVFDRELLGRKWKHVIEPRFVYRYVTGVNDFANRPAVRRTRHPERYSRSAVRICDAPVCEARDVVQSRNVKPR